jgi:microcystin-dependent protein
MGTTTNFALRYPELTDPPDIQGDIKKLAQDADAYLPAVPLGSALEWDYLPASIPSWALLSYGQAISRTTYSKLHTLASAASYPHGSGDGSTTFNIADKRGRISVGKDDMGGTAASRITAAISGTAGTVLGAAVGNEGVTLATAQIPSHDHSGVTNYQSADHTHSGNTSGQSADHTHGGNPDPTHAHNILYYSGDYDTGYVAASDQPWGGVIGTWGAGTGQYTGGVTYNHLHGLTTGGVNQNHYHLTYAQGGGGTHPNTQPTIICNKFVRVL